MDWNSKDFQNSDRIHFFDIIRMHWDIGKDPIVNSNSDKNIDTTFSWFDGRAVNFTKDESIKKREMFPSSSIENIYKSFEYIESLSRAESNINPLQTNREVHSYLNLPKIKSGTCMDQFGSLYEFEQKDDFFESATITHKVLKLVIPPNIKLVFIPPYIRLFVKLKRFNIHKIFRSKIKM